MRVKKNVEISEYHQPTFIGYESVEKIECNEMKHTRSIRNNTSLSNIFNNINFSPKLEFSEHHEKKLTAESIFRNMKNKKIMNEKKIANLEISSISSYL